MKKHFFFLFGFVLFAFAACNVDNTVNYRPEIQFYKNPTTNKMDTLNIYYTDLAGVYRLDTVAVGDTINFQIYVTGYTNNLKSLIITQSADSLSKMLLPSKSSMDSIFLSTSNYAEGKFLMNGTATSLFFPFKYVAKKVSKEAKLTFSVVSDASYDFNQFSFTLKTPIVAAK